jgi:D-arginine dehydrogenase
VTSAPGAGVARTDVVVVGGGIAGVSAAAFAAQGGAQVVLLEREPVLSAHTTGRSAALYLSNYGPAQVRRLTVASRAFFEAPPAGFASTPLLSPRGQLWVGGAADRDLLAGLADEGRALDPTIRFVDGDEVRRRCPVLRPEAAAYGVLEPGASDIDVAGLHAGFVRLLRAAGGVVTTSASLVAARRDGSAWSVETVGRTYACAVLVDAAGAWGDVVASAAGVRPVGLRPLRRTAATVALPPGVDARGWPAVVDAAGSWYFKPEGDGLLVSPADEIPSEPVDARPEDVDVALALERVAAATTLPLRSVRTAWAGLRTFAPDGELVLGPDDEVPSFVWCVGQGGYGIQSSPAVGRLAADLALGRAPSWAAAAGVDLAAVSPARLRGAGSGRS